MSVNEVRQKPNLHPDWIDSRATEIVRTLQKAGFETYLVGGCVRDLIAGIPPKDFDIATSARPNQVKRLVPYSYVIGRRFRLVLVKRGEDQFEVATFRRSPTPEEEQAAPDDQPFGDNVFGSPEEDAKRRDFTFNSLFYDPVGENVLDYCGGLRDVEDRIVRMIGDPSARLVEDPIRILRALRLAHKLNFSIEPTLREAMKNHAHELLKTALPRRREEMLKLLKLEDPARVFHEAHDLGILQHAFPTLHRVYDSPAQADEFELYLHRIHEITGSSNEPVDRFGALVLAYVRATLQQDPFQPLEVGEFLDLPQIRKLFRDELGMFNMEQKVIASALHHQTSLVDIEDFKRRGRRRQGGFLRQDGIELAIAFARADHALPPAVLNYWTDRFYNLTEEERITSPQTSDSQS